MPEGDTIHTLARIMEAELRGLLLERVEIQREPAPFLEKRTVRSVRAVGKHLVIDLGELHIRTHLGLHGSWHRYRREEKWKRPAWQASLLVRTSDSIYVCFDAREVACFDNARAKFHRSLERLGPDLLAPTPKLDEVLKRIRRQDRERAIADALLDQTVASGIGNVYKSEVLFLTGDHPKTPLDDLNDAKLVEIYQTAAKWMKANLGRGRRVTTDAAQREQLWVYRRTGRPCLKCATPIEFARMERGRSTFWCPRCQRV